jgi:hypothetical protein
MTHFEVLLRSLPEYTEDNYKQVIQQYECSSDQDSNLKIPYYESRNHSYTSLLGLLAFRQFSSFRHLSYTFLL